MICFEEPEPGVQQPLPQFHDLGGEGFNLGILTVAARHLRHLPFIFYSGLHSLVFRDLGNVDSG